MKRIIPFILALATLSCSKEKAPEAQNTNIPKPQLAIATKTFGAPLSEIKCYKLFNGYNSSDDFEASGVYALGSYYYVVFDNRFKLGKVLNTLPVNSSSNTLTGSGSGSSNFESITYDYYNTPNFYVGIESEKNGSNYYPKVREYDASLNYQSALWTDIAFNSSNNNKAMEGMAYVRRGSDDYILALIEGTGTIYVLKQTGSGWVTQSTISAPVSFMDYSDISISGSKVAITSQEDAQLWIGTLSSTSWAFTGSGTVYDFPRCDNNGIIGAGSNILYSEIEGVSFINDSTIVTCTDKSSSSATSYQKAKDQSIQVFRIPH